MPESTASELWEFIDPAEYTPPPATITHAVKGRLKGLWARLKPAQPVPPNPIRAEEDLHRLTGDLLECGVPRLDGSEAAASLMATLERSGGWGDTRGGNALWIGPPHSGKAQALSALARMQGWPIVAPPSTEQILSRDLGWLASVPDSETPWVLPELQRCFLRHPDGLTLVRQFFHRLQAGALRAGIIGVDSWAWGFLSHAIRARPALTLALQAFDPERLPQWFRAHAARDLLFRQSDNGALVMPPPEGLADATDTTAGASPFLKHLAAYSRGIPGVALDLWRSALRRGPEAGLAAQKEAEATCELGTTIWVLPWDEVRKPALPLGFGSEHALLLHTLLIHDGLPAAVATELLPFSADLATRARMDLLGSGLMEDDGETWRVSAAGYPCARGYLDGEGYLTDNF